MLTALLLLIQFLDDPYRGGFGGLQPVAMERTLGILEQERGLTGETGALPCDAEGERRWQCVGGQRAARPTPVCACRQAERSAAELDKVMWAAQAAA